MESMTDVGRQTLKGTSKPELEAVMGALEQKARNRELGGGQRAKLPLRPEGRGPAQGEQHHLCPRGQDGRTRPRGSLRPQPWR